MDIYCIPPVSQLELMNLGSRYFCLAQLYQKHESYQEFFKQKVAEGKWITLDNGTGDHNSISQEVLFEIMLDLMPSEVIPLDTLYNAQKTINDTFDFIDKMESLGLNKKIQVLACPQGATREEWLGCYNIFLSDDRIHTIGMSKLAIPWVVSRSTKDMNIARDRNVMFDYLQSLDLIKKPLHMLGAGEPWEYDHYKGCEFIRSTDSCFTIWSAMNEVSFENDKDFKRIPTPRNYFDLELSEKELSLARQNIAIFKERLQWTK